VTATGSFKLLLNLPEVLRSDGLFMLVSEPAVAGSGLPPAEGIAAAPCYQNPAVCAQYAAIVQIFPISFQSFTLKKTVYREAWICSTEFCKVLEETVNLKEGLFDEQKIKK